MKNEIQVFQNSQFGQIRVVDRSGDVWFVAKDVCEILGLSNTTEALIGLDNDEKRTLTNPEVGNNISKLRIISESGLYHLVFKSRKEEAQTFRKWVTSDVLPAIRKTGGYHVAHAPVEFLPPTMPELQIAESAARMLRMSDTSKLRMLSGICRAKGIPDKFLPEYTDEQLTRSLGDLLTEHGSNLTARAVNPILIDMGLLEEIERRSKKGVKRFKSITSAGLRYGKNETSTQSPNETQPRYFVSKFPELIERVNQWVHTKTVSV